MTTRALSKRIDRLEEIIEAYSKFGSGCTCFPGPAPPFFVFPVFEAIAFKIKCPLHGDRFQLYPRLFTPDWLREREIKKGWPRRTEQYLKAWNGVFHATYGPSRKWWLRDGAGYCRRKYWQTQEVVRLATLPLTSQPNRLERTHSPFPPDAYPAILACPKTSPHSGLQLIESVPSQTSPICRPQTDVCWQ